MPHTETLASLLPATPTALAGIALQGTAEGAPAESHRQHTCRHQPLNRLSSHPESCHCGPPSFIRLVLVTTGGPSTARWDTGSPLPGLRTPHSSPHPPARSGRPVGAVGRTDWARKYAGSVANSSRACRSLSGSDGPSAVDTLYAPRSTPPRLQVGGRARIGTERGAKGHTSKRGRPISSAWPKGARAWRSASSRIGDSQKVTD